MTVPGLQTMLDVVRRPVSDRLTVLVRPDPRLGFVVLNVWHDVGAMHDPPGRSGLAHVVEHVISGHASGASGRRGSANATTAFERTNYVDTGPPDALPDLLDRAARRLRQAGDGIDDELLDRHRRVVLEEIHERQEAARFGSGLRRSLRLLFGAEHPFGKPPMGQPADIATITADDAGRFARQRYGTARMIVAIVGPMHSGRAADLAGRTLAGLPIGADSLAGDLVPPAIGHRLREDVAEGQPTGLLRYTFALPPESSGWHGAGSGVAGEVAMAVLAGQTWSVLGQDLIRQYRLLGASAQHVRCGRGFSLGLLKLSAPADVDLDDLDLAVTGRLRDLAAAGPPEDTLDAAKARCAKDRLTVLSQARSLAEELCAQESWVGTRHPVDRLAALDAVTGEHVASVAARHLAEPALVAFHPENQSTSWII